MTERTTVQTLDDVAALLRPRKRLKPDQQAAVGAVLAAEYAKPGASISKLAEATGRSYGWVHRVLTAADVTLRPRGGADRKKALTK